MQWIQCMQYLYCGFTFECGDFQFKLWQKWTSPQIILSQIWRIDRCWKRHQYFTIQYCGINNDSTQKKYKKFVNNTLRNVSSFFFPSKKMFVTMQMPVLQYKLHGKHFFFMEKKKCAQKIPTSYNNDHFVFVSLSCHF